MHVLLGAVTLAPSNLYFLLFTLQAIPAMLLALVLSFDHRRSKDLVNLLDMHSSKGHKYIWYALPGYAIGLVTALAAGILTNSPQPALLYLVSPFVGFQVDLYYCYSPMRVDGSCRVKLWCSAKLEVFFDKIISNLHLDMTESFH